MHPRARPALPAIACACSPHPPGPSLQRLPVDCCPVCTLQCACAKCARRLRYVAGVLETECQAQRCGVAEVVFDDLYELCRAKKLKEDAGGDAGAGGRKARGAAPDPDPDDAPDDAALPRKRRRVRKEVELEGARRADDLALTQLSAY